MFHSLRFCRGLLRDDDHAAHERPYEGMCDCVFRLLGCSDTVPLWKSLHSLNHLPYVTLYDVFYAIIHLTAWGRTDGILADLNKEAKPENASARCDMRFIFHLLNVHFLGVNSGRTYVFVVAI